MVNCRLCGGEAQLHFSAKVLKKHDANFCYCAACDHVFAQDPHWLEEAYSDAIVKTDTDIAVRNIFTSLRLAAILYFAFGDKGRGHYADVAGGYGLLVRLMRDLGFNYFWSDPYAENLFARGFEYSAALGNCTVISAVEVLEHTLNPEAFLKENLATHGADTIVFTTMLFADDQPPAARQWGYYSLDTGQHIAFFSKKGLEKLGQRLGMDYHPLGRIHLFTRRKVSPWRLAIASNRLMTLPLAFFAAHRLGSRRGRDQTLLSKQVS